MPLVVDAAPDADIGLKLPGLLSLWSAAILPVGVVVIPFMTLTSDRSATVPFDSILMSFEDRSSAWRSVDVPFILLSIRSDSRASKAPNKGERRLSTTLL